MKSDPKECLYCQNNETLHNLMIEIAQLSVSRVFLFKEQTYRGRCLVAYKDHVNDLNELSDEERNAFMADVNRAAKAIHAAFHPDKLNYGAYGDTGCHLHMHIVPRWVGDANFMTVIDSTKVLPQRLRDTRALFAEAWKDLSC